MFIFRVRDFNNPLIVPLISSQPVYATGVGNFVEDSVILSNENRKFDC